MSNFKKPWDQQEKEPDEYYRKFLIFRDLGSERTLLNAQTLEEPNRTRPEASSAWKRMSSNWNWLARADAYDLSIQKTASKEVEANDKLIKATAENLQLTILKRIQKIAETGDLTKLDRNDLGIYNLLLSSKSKASDFVNNVVKNMQSQRLEVKVSKVPDFQWD